MYLLDWCGGAPLLLTLVTSTCCDRMRHMALRREIERERERERKSMRLIAKLRRARAIKARSRFERVGGGGAPTCPRPRCPPGRRREAATLGTG